jgi:hypothetical protein
MLSCDRSKISALENDLREAVAEEFVGQLSEVLNLGAGEKAALMEAMRNSQRSYVVPPEAPPKAYQLVRELFDRLDRMPERQIDALRIVLDFSPDTWLGPGATRHRVWRKDKLWKEESVP